MKDKSSRVPYCLGHILQAIERIDLEALTADDQETVIKVIDAMIAKERMASALTPVDASA